MFSRSPSPSFQAWDREQKVRGRGPIREEDDTIVGMSKIPILKKRIKLKPSKPSPHIPPSHQIVTATQTEDEEDEDEKNENAGDDGDDEEDEEEEGESKTEAETDTGSEGEENDDGDGEEGETTDDEGASTVDESDTESAVIRDVPPQFRSRTATIGTNTKNKNSYVPPPTFTYSTDNEKRNTSKPLLDVANANLRRYSSRGFDVTLDKKKVREKRSEKDILRMLNALNNNDFFNDVVAVPVDSNKKKKKTAISNDDDKDRGGAGKSKGTGAGGNNDDNDNEEDKSVKYAKGTKKQAQHRTSQRRQTGFPKKLQNLDEDDEADEDDEPPPMSPAVLKAQVQNKSGKKKAAAADSSPNHSDNDTSKGDDNKSKKSGNKSGKGTSTKSDENKSSKSKGNSDGKKSKKSTKSGEGNSNVNDNDSTPPSSPPPFTSSDDGSGSDKKRKSKRRSSSAKSDKEQEKQTQAPDKDGVTPVDMDKLPAAVQAQLMSHCQYNPCGCKPCCVGSPNAFMINGGGGCCPRRGAVRKRCCCTRAPCFSPCPCRRCRVFHYCFNILNRNEVRPEDMFLGLNLYEHTIRKQDWNDRQKQNSIDKPYLPGPFNYDNVDPPPPGQEGDEDMASKAKNWPQAPEGYMDVVTAAMGTGAKRNSSPKDCVPPCRINPWVSEYATSFKDHSEEMRRTTARYPYFDGGCCGGGRGGC